MNRTAKIFTETMDDGYRTFEGIVVELFQVDERVDTRFPKNMQYAKEIVSEWVNGR